MNVNLSVIIPAFNVEDYIEECIDSIYGQPMDNFEVICIDDGSTDNTGRIIDRLAETRNNLRVIHQSNKGISVARNRGIELAEGRYMIFCDGDDIVGEGTLEGITEICDSNKLDMLYFAYDFFSDSKDIEDIYKKPLNVNMVKGQYGDSVVSGREMLYRFYSNGDFLITACAYIVSKAFWTEQNISFTEGMVYEDGPVSVELYLRAERVMFVNRVVNRRRIRLGSITRSKIEISHVEGLFKGIIMMIREHNAHEEMDCNTTEVIDSYITRRIIVFGQNYGALSEEDKKRFVESLAPDERLLLTCFIQPKVENRKLKAKNKKIRKKLKKIENSRAYKIGMAITETRNFIKKFHSKEK